MPRKKVRPVIVGFRVSEHEKSLLDQAAEEMGCPLSDCIRWALRREFAVAFEQGEGKGPLKGGR
jgi:hypothetical protein